MSIRTRAWRIQRSLHANDNLQKQITASPFYLHDLLFVTLFST